MSTEAQAAAKPAGQVEDTAKSGQQPDKEGQQPTDDELWGQVQADRENSVDGELEGAGDQDEDPLAGLPEATRKLITEIQAKTVEQDQLLKDANKKLATAHGTIGNLSQRLAESMKEFGRIKPVVEKAESTAKAEEAKAKAEQEARLKELDETMGELPEVKAYVDLKLAGLKPAEPATPSADDEPAPETPEQIRAKLTAERELSDRHPKWIETIKSDDFQKWLEKQPDDIKALGASENVADADTMLTAFKKHKNDAAEIARVEAERKERLRRGETVEGVGPGGKGGDPSKDGLWNQVKRDREKTRSSA